MNPPLVRDAFLEPALRLLPTLDSYRDDLDFSDPEFLTLGVRRINTFHPSGRSFLQSARQCDLTGVSLRAYFGAVRSPRRLALLHQLNTTVMSWLWTDTTLRMRPTNRQPRQPVDGWKYRTP